MKIKHTPVLLLLGLGLGHAQEITTETIPLPKEQIQILDSIKVQQVSGDLPTTVVATQVRDTVVFALEDMANARKYDSLWLRELSTLR